MKKTAFLIVGIICATAVIANALVCAEHPFPLDGPTFKWTLTSFDFGKVKLNKPVTHEFKFTNTGNEPLIIASVKASCGCTVAEYSKDPIPVGGQGFVKATYNAAKVGTFSKTVTVNSNTETGVAILTVTGEVIE